MKLLNYSSSLIAVGREMKQFLRLAIPLASAQLTQSLTGFFDTLMMGRLGAETLAAGGTGCFKFFSFSFYGWRFGDGNNARDRSSLRGKG